MERPVLTVAEREALATFLSVDPAASEEEVARAWASNYWHNEGLRFKEGTPIDGVRVSSEKLVAIASHFEAEMCSAR